MSSEGTDLTSPDFEALARELHKLGIYIGMQTTQHGLLVAALSRPSAIPLCARKPIGPRPRCPPDADLTHWSISLSQPTVAGFHRREQPSVAC